MGLCSRRYLFLSLCLLQMALVVERQVFDFLGFLWVPILVNFFEIIFIIFGFFGAYQYRTKYLLAYLLWHIFWIGWNIFMICLYLNVAGLDHEKNKVLKLDLNSDSWWKKEGPGCKVKDVDAIPVEYEGCLIDYIHVEIAQAGLQCLFAFLNSIIGICLSRTFSEEDDTFNYEKPDGPQNILLHPMYVSASDNLHSFNEFINFTNSTDLFHTKRRQKPNRHVLVDEIHNPMRSNSFSSSYMSNNKRSRRPQSLCSEAFFDI